ncbi:stage II sporulation protein P [Halalkalibacillus sediminis]|uniref:Stage II sporulation protein P n=1 Tax=Halalkalibacillus sediminis TaxID=2018042 RepID=A0A2I0QXI3_9BACI|nr:stage II sporulation protein P [Halalkalibacillus sediminis]PKR79047.1 stage II sporulation protein P [Halalkalibacillus sediminis]
MKPRLKINMGQLNKWKKHPFLIFQVLFLALLLLTPLFSFKPFHEASSNIWNHWFNEVDGESFSLFMTLDQPVFAGMVDHDDDVLSVTDIALPLLTNLPYRDVRLLFGQELPNFPRSNSQIVVAGSGTNYLTTSIESAPPEDLFEEGNEKTEGTNKTPYSEEAIFIYTTHNREGFLPHLPEGTKPNESFHTTENVMKLSKYLKNEFESYGIPSYADQTDYYHRLQQEGLAYHQSYEISRPVVQEVQSQNEEVTYYIDIHRDAQPRNITTTEIDGQSVGKLMFVIGGEHENYEKNMEFSVDLHNALQEKYPGLSRGVEVKKGSSTNGVFNQDISGRAILVEVGGFENSFDELNRSLDILAETFSELYFEKHEAEKQ